ncbi:longitudinals lacking protein, isoforms H/M/V-like [Contarinia nasturtii]|uniref:longitudinals lacking protein, isoforms H/M/V-like n=1 Tax=Contarinia nasturtii TaxID=265458 RepID=UPI0012D449D5|nr:longitudinals lacking protein, isoforms H/M/V-like [Contarinia nasturtii]
MTGDQYKLQWNQHHPNLLTVFSSLLHSNQMVDVTIVMENREIHAHKIVLSACSPFFQNIFLRNSCKHPVIILTGIKYSFMKSLIEFIYNGEVNIYQDDLVELLRIANILKIKGLDEIKSVIESTITTEEKNLSSSTVQSEDEKLNFPSTSDQTKSTKKRKSVTFADATDVVCDRFNSNFDDSPSDDKGNGKRKQKSLSNVCTITEIKTECDQEEHNNDDRAENKLIVKINPNNLCTTTSRAFEENQLNETPPTNQRISYSRKMIRKNANFLHALEAVRDKGMGFCKAAKIYGVNNRTLWLEYQKLGYPMKNSRKKSES